MKFPPGVTVYDKKVKSHWREFAFVLHQVQQAIDPIVSLRAILSSWGGISKALVENSRKRKPQLANYKFC